MCVVSVGLVSMAPSARAAEGFIDVAGNVHAPAINRVAEEGITDGCNTQGPRYCPKAPVQRGQMATFLLRTMRIAGIEPAAGAPDAFSDDGTSLHQDAINILAGAGVVLGGADGLYRPTSAVTRGQMAQFLQRAFDLPAGSASGFTDVSAGQDAAVAAVASAGITRGCSTTTFCPGLPVTRDQMASFLVRTLDFSTDGSPGEIDPDAPVPPDVGPDPATAPISGDPNAPDAGGDPTAPDGDIQIYPAARAAGSGGDPATSMPPVINGLPGGHGGAPPAETPTMGSATSGNEAIGYAGQPVFELWGSGYLPYNDLPANVGRLENFDANGNPMGGCSGTVVATDLVLTAAHCVNTASCFRFWPDLYGTQARYGAWDSCQAWYAVNYDSPNQWRLVYDYALVKMAPNGSGSIGDVVGTSTVLMDTAGLNMPKYNMGYPSEGWFASGNCAPGGTACYPWFCWAPDSGRFNWGDGWSSMGWGCDANGGISGGPVFADYNGRRYVVSVNSTGGSIVPCPVACSSNRNSYYMINMWGPSFRSGAFDVFLNEVLAF